MSDETGSESSEGRTRGPGRGPAAAVVVLLSALAVLARSWGRRKAASERVTADEADVSADEAHVSADEADVSAMAEAGVPEVPPTPAEALAAAHVMIRERFAAARAARDLPSRTDHFAALLRELAAHEAAEQTAYHGVVDARQRLAEEDEAARTIARLEQLGVDSEAYGLQLDLIREGVERHAQAEETQEMPEFLDRADQRQQRRFVALLKAAQRIAGQLSGTTFAEMHDAALATLGSSDEG